MASVRTAVILSILYWIVAVVFAIFAPRGDWIDLRWPISIYFFAIPTTVLLWLFWFTTRYLALPFPGHRFALVGLALPIVFVAVAWGGAVWYGQRRQQRLAAQFSAAALGAISDEPLLDAQGPIGVRLHYRVTYPEGLDLDQDHGAFAQVGLQRGGGLFFTLRRTVTPRVSGTFGAGSYDITEDFLPRFLPPAIVYSKPEPSTEDRCFRWYPDMSRQDVLTAAPQNLAITVYLAPAPLLKSTIGAYHLADFFETAVKEGSLDCAQKSG